MSSRPIIKREGLLFFKCTAAQVLSHSQRAVIYCPCPGVMGCGL